MVINLVGVSRGIGYVMQVVFLFFCNDCCLFPRVFCWEFGLFVLMGLGDLFWFSCFLFLFDLEGCVFLFFIGAGFREVARVGSGILIFG